MAQGAKDFLITRSKLYLMTHSRAMADLDGSWYFLHWSANLPQGFVRDVYRIKTGEQLQLELLAKQKGPGHHAYGTVDACFVTKERMHFIWAEVTPGGNHLRLVAADFDVAKKTWSGERVLLRQKKFTSWAHPTVVVVPDRLIHYFWTINEGDGQLTKQGGLFYQHGKQDTATRLSGSIDGFKTLVLGKRIVVCYTLPAAVDTVYFRVIDGDQVGPEIAIRLFQGRKHSLGGERLVLAPAGEDRFWLVNTLDIGVFHEFTLAAQE